MMIMSMSFSSIFSVFSSLFGAAVLVGFIIVPIIHLLYLFFAAHHTIKPLISINLCHANSGFSILTSDMFYLTALALATSFFLSVIVYLVGVILKNDKLIAFMKTEISDFFITIGLVTIGIALLYLPCKINILQFNTSGGNVVKMNAYDSAFFFLQFSKFYSFMSVDVAVVIGVVTLFVLKSFISNNIFGGISLPVFSGLSLMLKPALSNVVMMPSLSFVLYSFQVLLYEFITYGAIKYLVPLGVLFRAFSPLKKIGGVIIGFAIGATLFYTMILAFSWYFAHPYMKYLDFQLKGFNDREYFIDYKISFSGDSQYYEKIFSAVGLYQDVEKEAETLNSKYNTQDTSNAIYNKDSEKWAREFGNDINDKKNNKSDGIIAGIFRFFSTSCGTFTILLAVVPLINILVVITGVRFFSKFFGMDLDISNLTRVI